MTRTEGKILNIFLVSSKIKTLRKYLVDSLIWRTWLGIHLVHKVQLIHEIFA
jgi:hypothetical protein